MPLPKRSACLPITLRATAELRMSLRFKALLAPPGRAFEFKERAFSEQMAIEKLPSSAMAGGGKTPPRIG